MRYEIYPTTAEHIISATDAVILKGNSSDLGYVAQFMDVPNESAKNALNMGEQLGLIKFDETTNMFFPLSTFATYLVSSNERQKAVIVRLLLEQYEPYKLFKNRLTVTGFVNVASEQLKAFYNLQAHREEIKNTLTSLGTYAHSLISEGAGLYKVVESISNDVSYFLQFDDIVSEKEKSELIVRKLLRSASSTLVDPIETLEPLIVAYLKLKDVNQDSRSPILYAGNAFESFLVKFGDHFGVQLQGANGINAKIDRLASANLIKSKHKFMAKYLGHVRNACDHGIDQEIGTTWDITAKSSFEFVHLTLTCIDVLVDSISGVYKI